MDSIIQREFQNLEEAFLSLPQKIQESSERVADYMEQIFILVGSEDVYSMDTRTQARLKLELSDTVKWAAKYYDLGKAFVPEMYHQLRPDFTSEELALYQSMPANGAIMVESLIQKQGKMKQTNINILLEMVQYHQEHWNGKGISEGLSEGAIPVLARLVRVAETFDRLVMGKHSEKPFEYAIQALQELSGVELDPMVVGIAVENKNQLRRIFNKYKGQSQMIPQSECFVKRRATRPYELFYRPIYGQQEKATVALEADLRFRDGKEWLTYQEVEPTMKKNKLVPDLGNCIFLEACDTVNRLKTCEIPIQFILLNPPTGWLNGRTIVKGLPSMLEDTRVEAGQMGIVVDVEQFRKRSKTMAENLQKLKEAGMQVMLTGCDMEEFTGVELKEAGITILRLRGDVGAKLSSDECIAYCNSVADEGIGMAAEDMDKKSYKALYYRNRIEYSSDIVSGDYKTENQMVEDELLIMEQE